VKITETEAYVANWPVFAAKELDALRAERDALEADYRRIIIEVLACDPLPASQQPDDQLEPPWNVIARLRAERDALREAAGKVCDVHANGSVFELLEPIADLRALLNPEAK
jgi:hypothetical protein